MDSPIICTTELNGVIKVYEPLILDCPPINERVIVAFTLRTPDDGDDRKPGRTELKIGRAVSSTEGGSKGLTLERHGIFWEGDCTEDWYWSESPNDIINPGRVNNTLCRPLYDSPDKVCDGGTQNNNRGTVYQDVLGVWNAGGCQGKLVFEVFQGGNYGPGECLQPLTQVCQGTPISMPTSMPAPSLAVPSSMPTATTTSTTVGPTIGAPSPVTNTMYPTTGATTAISSEGATKNTSSAAIASAPSPFMFLLLMFWVRFV